MDVAYAVIDRLASRGETVAVAESCTGGLVGHLLTDVSGASRAFLGGIIAYSNEAKHSLLGVPVDVLRDYGAVSENAVTLMALGVRTALHADWGVGVSGVLGPSGGTDEKPVGTVWLAIAAPDGTVLAERYRWNDDRSGNKRSTAEQALMMLFSHLASMRS